MMSYWDTGLPLGFSLFIPTDWLSGLIGPVLNSTDRERPQRRAWEATRPPSRAEPRGAASTQLHITWHWNRPDHLFLLHQRKINFHYCLRYWTIKFWTLTAGDKSKILTSIHNSSGNRWINKSIGLLNHCQCSSVLHGSLWMNLTLSHNEHAVSHWCQQINATCCDLMLRWCRMSGTTPITCLCFGVFLCLQYIFYSLL